MTAPHITYLLMPGRHHAVTCFQVQYLQQLLQQYPNAQVVWAVTSADHTGTQRNPIRGSRRLGIIEAVATAAQIPSEVFLIPNQRQRDDFFHYLTEEIRVQTDGRVDMTPENTIVATSTKEVIEQYQTRGFMVVTLEQESSELLPWDLVLRIIRAGKDWQTDATIQSAMHPVCYAMYVRYHIADRIQAIYADPLVQSDDGDITVTRDYSTYRQAFEDNAWRKVNDIAPYVRPGKIVDVGCATGQTLKLLSEQPELFESDFYGVEVARPLYEICKQRLTNGESGDANMFFYQRNIMQAELLKPRTMDTIITMALTHEIESYMGRGELSRFLARAYDMCAPGGVYINYDVVGPDEPDRQVYVDFTSDDGENPRDLGWELEGVKLSDFLRKLSTKSRFLRFVKDFRATEGDGIKVKTEHVNDHEYYVMRWADLCDFLAKKDYVNSWKSEMHERFCFFSHDEWCKHVQAAGFTLAEGTRAVQNDWLIENRFAPAAKVYFYEGNSLIEAPQPTTNTLLVCEKRL